MVRRKTDSRRFGHPTDGDSEKSKTSIIVNKRTRKRRALQEIRLLRKSVNLLIPRQPFTRLVAEIMTDFFPIDRYRIQRLALEALQEALEAYLVQFFEDCILLTYHAKRVTLQVNDFRLMRRLRGRQDIVNR